MIRSSLSRQSRNIEVLVGSGRKGFVDGPGDAAQFSGPEGVTVDDEGSIIIEDSLLFIMNQ